MKKEKWKSWERKNEGNEWKFLDPKLSCKRNKFVSYLVLGWTTNTCRSLYTIFIYCWISNFTWFYNSPSTSYFFPPFCSFSHSRIFFLFHWPIFSSKPSHLQLTCHPFVRPKTPPNHRRLHCHLLSMPTPQARFSIRKLSSLLENNLKVEHQQQAWTYLSSNNYSEFYSNKKTSFN